MDHTGLQTGTSITDGQARVAVVTMYIFVNQGILIAHLAVHISFYSNKPKHRI